MNRDGKERLGALRKLLEEGELSTQEELREKLEKQEFAVTQSTISRDLRKIGAVRAVDGEGRTVYRLSEGLEPPVTAGSFGISCAKLQPTARSSSFTQRSDPPPSSRAIWTMSARTEFWGRSRATIRFSSLPRASIPKMSKPPSGPFVSV